MTTRTRAKKQRMTWLWGDKQRGVSLNRVYYKTPRWRIAFWRKGRLSSTVEHPGKSEALRKGKEYAREVKTGGFIF